MPERILGLSVLWSESRQVPWRPSPGSFGPTTCRNRCATRSVMNEEMIREAARALAARLTLLLDESLAGDTRMTRDKVELAQGLVATVEDLLLPSIVGTT